MIKDGSDSESIVDHFLGVMTAGRETTSTTMGWVIWHLLRDRASLQRLTDEMHALGDTELTVEVLEGCKFLKAVTNEGKKTILIASSADEPLQLSALRHPCLCSPASRSPRSCSRAAAATGARRCWSRKDQS